jgi:hypothetical protein
MRPKHWLERPTSEHLAARPGKAIPPPAFQVDSANLGAFQKLAAGSFERDQSVNHDIAAMGEFERMVGILLFG